MNDKVATLVTRKDAHNAETIEILRDLLTRAESGEIQSVAIAAIDATGGSFTVSSPGDYFQQIIGAIEMLKHRMIHDNL